MLLNGKLLTYSTGDTRHITFVEKDEKSLQRGGDSDYDKRNILVVICETDIP
jgi:hypothetical protein